MATDYRQADDPFRQSPESGVLKPIDCECIWGEAMDDPAEPLHDWPPPLVPPCPMLDDFLMNGTAHFRYMVSEESSLAHSEWTIEEVERLIQLAKDGRLHDGRDSDISGTLENEMLRGLSFLNATGKHVLVIGSTYPWLEAIALAAGAAHVTTLEYRPILSHHPNLSTLTMSGLTELYRASSGRLSFDIITSHSSLEHRSAQTSIVLLTLFFLNNLLILL